MEHNQLVLSTPFLVAHYNISSISTVMVHELDLRQGNDEELIQNVLCMRATQDVPLGSERVESVKCC